MKNNTSNIFDSRITFLFFGIIIGGLVMGVMQFYRIGPMFSDASFGDKQECLQNAGYFALNEQYEAMIERYRDHEIPEDISDMLSRWESQMQQIFTSCSVLDEPEDGPRS